MPIPLPGIRTCGRDLRACCWHFHSRPLSARRGRSSRCAAPHQAPPHRRDPRAASCHNGLTFDRFLADLKQQAVAAGVSQRAIAEASPYLVYRPGHRQSRPRPARVRPALHPVRRPHGGRLPHAAGAGNTSRRYAQAFARAEKEYGVPPAVIAAFWGLESDFGANMGNLPTLRSLVSLAYDCRRSEMFPGRDHRCAEDHRPRRSFAGRDDRLVGRRTRPDAIPADALFQLCRGLRRRRPSQSVAQPGRT